eukprot:scaffold248382_cov77-Cyclotella_meneghiniana.AAC.3
MGASSSKQWDDLTLAPAKSIAENKASAISSALVTTSETTKAKASSGKSWINEADEVLWTIQPVARFKPHSYVQDKDGNRIAVIISHRKGMKSCTNYICKFEPSYDKQDPLTTEQLEKASLEKDMKIYGFAKIDTERGMSTAKSIYNGVTMAKAQTKGMTMKPCVEVAAGVDLLAVVLIGYALAGDESAAGALAGAGVY